MSTRFPIWHPEVHDPDKVPRRMDCAGYRACLSDALRLGWPGFSCASCGSYDRLGELDLKRDYEGLSNLLVAMNGGSLERRQRTERNRPAETPPTPHHSRRDPSAPVAVGDDLTGEYEFAGGRLRRVTVDGNGQGDHRCDHRRNGKSRV